MFQYIYGKCSRIRPFSGRRRRSLHSVNMLEIVLLLCIFVYIPISTTFVSSTNPTVVVDESSKENIVSDIRTIIADDTSMTNPKSLLESIWDTFKQSFDSATTTYTTTTINTHSRMMNQPQQSTTTKLSQQQRRQQEDINEIINRRIVLFEETLEEHYTNELLKASSPQFKSYHNKQQRQQQQQQNDDADQSTTSTNKKTLKNKINSPLRWKQIQDNTICFCFLENSNSYWSFQYCPNTGYLYQGRIKKRQNDKDHNINENNNNNNNRDLLIFQSQYNLGKYRRSLIKPTTKRQNEHDIVIDKTTSILQSKYPDAVNIELFANGDTCIVDTINEQQQSSISSNNQRLSIVVFHDRITSDTCTDSTTTYENDNNNAQNELWIESVEEFRLCHYVFHICLSSTSSKKNGKAKKVSNMDHDDPATATIQQELLNNTTLSETEMKHMNETLQYIQNVIQQYSRKTHADLYHRTTSPDVITSLQIGMPPMPQSRVAENLQLIRNMFTHAYDSYMYNAYPAQEIKPITCTPTTFQLVKIPALTLLDSLDTLIVLGNYTEFARSVERIRELNQRLASESPIFGGGKGQQYGLFHLNQNVSVFETNIRVLGGLLSAHQLAEAFLTNKVLENDVWTMSDDVDDDKNNIQRTIRIGTSISQQEEEDCHETKAVCTNNDMNNNAESSLLQSEGRRHSQQQQADCSIQSATQQSCTNNTTKFWEYDGFLLELANDIGERLLPAFETRTGIPYGTVNLLSGIPKGETTVASLAGGGTLSLEMELLGRLTGNTDFGRAAKLAARALWMRRSSNGLLGKHICTRRGDWHETLSGIGSNSDSFYEYLIKHHTLFPEDSDFWFQLVAAYGGVHNESRIGEWYGDVDMSRGVSMGGAFRKVFEALMAFYPGMQVLLGEVTPAARSLSSFFLVREFCNFLPERFNYGLWKVDTHGGKHFLRPEILESAYFLHRSTKGILHQFRDSSSNSSVADTSSWQWAGDFALHTIERLTRTECGYASLRDVSQRQHPKLINELPSYFLSETLKYLYLLFDENNILHTDEDHDWVFSTEAHPIHHEETAKHGNEQSHLKKMKNSLKERIKMRLGKHPKRVKPFFSSLIDEKWTEASQRHEFIGQLEPLLHQGKELYKSRISLYEMEQRNDGSSIVEPFLPMEGSSGDYDIFDERFHDTNPAYLTLRKLGQQDSLTSSCPNIYMTDFYWIRALNGGIADYTDTYVSRVHDNFVVPTNRVWLGSVDALAYHNSGVHIETYFQQSSKCPVRSAKHQSEDRRPHIEGRKAGLEESKTRFNMGDGMGSFEMASFSSGSGFLIEHKDSGTSLVTTLIEANERDPTQYILVYSNDINDPFDHRSVVMADFDGNSYSCVIDIYEVGIRSEEEESTCRIDQKEQGDSSSEAADASQRLTETLIAQFPCAPALFGPTHISNLKEEKIHLVEATIQGPGIGDEYGCQKRQVEVESSNPSAETENVIGDAVCENKAITMIYRGVCTFQEKSRNQKASRNSIGTIVINSEEEELFVMSGAGFEDNDTSNPKEFPTTVLVTGSDGAAILETIESFENNEDSEIRARISLIRDEADILQSSKGGFTVSSNMFWPVVRADDKSLQIYTHAGFGVHAQRLNKNTVKTNSADFEWQLYLVPVD